MDNIISHNLKVRNRFVSCCHKMTLVVKSHC